MTTGRPLWVMIAGPYSSGAASRAQRDANLRAMNDIALAVFNQGHLPIIGVNNALPLIDSAGDGDFDRIMMPYCLALVDRCDCCLRIGGPSAGADQEAQRFAAQGKPVYEKWEDLPAITVSSDGR